MHEVRTASPNDGNCPCLARPLAPLALTPPASRACLIIVGWQGSSPGPGPILRATVRVSSGEVQVPIIQVPRFWPRARRYACSLELLECLRDAARGLFGLASGAQVLKEIALKPRAHVQNRDVPIDRLHHVLPWSAYSLPVLLQPSSLVAAGFGYVFCISR